MDTYGVEFDGYGPEKIIHVYNPKIGMNGFVVIDNTALGPGKGGIRMTPTVSSQEVFKLARTMTWKNALAELPFGGAKSGIVAQPKNMSPAHKEAIVKAFAQAIRNVSPHEYVAAPDINMGKREMEIYAKANGTLSSTTGKPVELGGLPHELGSTGFGVFHATKVALDFLDLPLDKVRVAVEGFGNVGSFAVKYLTDAGATVVATSDSRGTIYKPDGLSFERLSTAKQETGSVISYGEGAKTLSSEEIISLPVDVLITAAVPDVIAAKDVDSIKAKLIVEGSNIPMSFQTEEFLHQKGILVVPDFLANAGGVISSYVEYTGGTQEEMFALVEEKIVATTRMVLKESRSEQQMPRQIAQQIAQKRVLQKCRICHVPGITNGAPA